MIRTSSYSSLSMKAKQKGARIERAIKADLERQGYFVIKSGGSLGCVDLIAIRNKVGETIIRSIQIKANHLPPPAERAVLHEYSKRFSSSNFYVEIAVKPDRKPVEWFLVLPDKIMGKEKLVS